MVAGPIRELWRYPVKSLQGEQLERTEIGDGIPGDRAWGIVEVETGRLLSAKTVGAMLGASARLVDGRCLITLPDGRDTSDDAADVDEVLSAWLGREVTLERATPGETRTIEIEWDEGQDEPGELPVFEFSTQPGWFYDSTSSLHLISTGTLAHIEAAAGPGAGAVRRYRPNIVVELDEPYGEEAWVDATLSLGSATAWVKKPTDRCVLITRALPGHEASREPLMFLARDNGRNAGISAQPRSPGTVSVGDLVTPTP